MKKSSRFEGDGNMAKARIEKYHGEPAIVVDGEAYPLMLILFGYSRFFLEFARDNEKLFLGISSLAIHAFIMGIVGTVWYFTLKEIKHKKSHAKHK